MKLKLVNGPLHGYEVETNSPETVDLLDSENGKVRRYRRGDFAVYVKEWATQEEYNKEMSVDHPAGT